MVIKGHRIMKNHHRKRNLPLRYDVVIIGSGVAGLYAAIGLPKSLKVLVINKSYPWECNTYYAQGGVSTAYDDADIPLHIKDTLDAGAGMCNSESVQLLSENSQTVIRDLIERGFLFDKDDEGNLLYTKEEEDEKKKKARRKES